MKKIIGVVVALSLFVMGLGFPSKAFAAKMWCNSLGPFRLGSKLNTAIGCIDIGNSEALYASFLRWGVGIGGGIAFLLIVYAGFMIMTAAGNPERLKAGQELMTAVIQGIVLLIFSIFLLKLIGVDILGLCKFGFGPSC